MESNCCLVFFLFGLSMLPKIYSDAFPSLILIKQKIFKDTYYDPADEIEYAGHKNNLVKFFISTDYYSKYHILYNACPRKDEPLRWTYALEIKGDITDLQPTTLERFVTGLFGKYDCEREIKPIALKYQSIYQTKILPEGFQLYDIGFIVYDNAQNKDQLKLYENAANEELPKGYRLVKFLKVTLNKLLGTIYSVSHEILGGQFLQPNLVFNPLPAYEKNNEEYGFDVDSLYTEENQRNILSSFFGQFDLEHSLIKVQLAPYQDFLLDTWKLTSFMNLNTVPMWNKVHSQWIKIEEFVRKVARELGDLSIETGTAQILQLYDVRHQLQPVYLVMHNDPYTENQERICNEGTDYGWSVYNNDFEKGLTYVCPLHKDIISKLDDQLEVSFSKFKLNDMQQLDDDEHYEMGFATEKIASLKKVNSNRY